MPKFKFRLFILSTLLFLFSLNSQAQPPISLFSTIYGKSQVPLAKVNDMIHAYFNVHNYRNIKVQVIYKKDLKPDHLLVFLFSKKYHSVKLARINVNPNYDALSIIRNYKIQKNDIAEQVDANVNDSPCPDSSIQFIAFAPNNDTLEQKITKNVALQAKDHGLKVITLLKDDATRENYLAYMSCPKVIGNFYDGDANPDLIITADGFISADTIKKKLAKKFQYRMTNIWLACEAFNDPMKTVMLKDAESQKYAAGKNDLLVGPSDRAAACAMDAAVAGKPMVEAFQKCYQEDDVTSDHWGFAGQGSDYFGKS